MKRLLLWLVLPLVLLGLSAAAPWAASSVAVRSSSGPPYPYNWPGMKKCGTFVTTKQHYRIFVLANRKLACRTAVAVIRAFWLGPSIEHKGADEASSWYVPARYPDWRCVQGAGAGSCSRGKLVAPYEVGNV